jgi:hypothetical protein
MVEMNKTCGTSSKIETHVAGSRISIKNEIVLSTNDMRKGTMTTMALITTIPINNVSQSEDAMKGESELSLMT